MQQSVCKNDRVASWMHSVERPAVEGEQVPCIVYDAECAFCRRWASRLKTWCSDRVDLMPLQDSRATAMTGRSVAELKRAMHLVQPDGTVYAGAGAVREILRYPAWGWLPGAMFGLPGAMSLAERAYAWVASRRRRIGCGGEHCRVSVDLPGKKR